MAGCEEAFAEVAGDDLFGVADGGEIDAGVPFQKYIDVCRYTLKLCFGQHRGGRKKRAEQFGDAAGVHEFSIVRAGAVAARLGCVGVRLEQ